MQMMSKQTFCAAHPKVSFDMAEDGATIVCVAVRDIKPGERLTFNYGVPELLEWDLAKRRAHLRRGLLFDCGCERCVAEEAAAAAAAGAAGAAAVAEHKPPAQKEREVQETVVEEAASASSRLLERRGWAIGAALLGVGVVVVAHCARRR